MSTLKTHNLQSPDASSVNIAMAPNAGMVVTGISTFQANATFSKNINLPDSSDATDGRIKFGANDDMMLFHYGGANYIDVSTNLNIRGSSSGNTIKIRPKQSHEGITLVPDNSVSLYFANSKKLETSNTGVTVTGTVAATAFTGDGSNLTNLPPSAPVGGSASNKVFFENDKVVSVNYQITSTKNAMTAGPVSVNAGIAVTVPSGCSWTIV